MKKTYKILLATVLALVALLTVGMLTVHAETAEGYELTITSTTGVGYDKVYLSVSGAVAKEVEIGKTYIIPKSAAIQITVMPKMGYALKGMYDQNGDNVITNAGDTVYSTPSLTSDATFDIVCEPREYNIYYNGAADGYQVIDSPSKHTFGTETVLENPVKNGYTFLHWERGTDKNTLPGEGEKLGKRESDGKTVLGTSVYADGDTIYLVPVFVPNKYPVYCYDYVYDPSLPNSQGDPLGSYEAWYVDMDSIITGKDIPDPKSYAGYYFDGSNALYYTTCQVKVAEDGQLINVIIRFYLPITYELEYGVQLGDKAPDFEGSLSFVNGVTAPSAHIYNQNTVIPDAVREGYLFDSWTVQVMKNGEWVTVDGHYLEENADGYLVLPDKVEVLASEENEGRLAIRLIANMTPEQFDIVYHWSDADPSDVVFDENAYGIYTYDGVLEIPDPVRRGYRFLGWTLTSGGQTETIDSVNGKTVIDGAYLADLTLTARWETKRFEVTLDGSGADDGYVGGTFEVTYHQVFSPAHVEIPARKGYTFLGFYTDATTDGLTPWIDADGNPTNQIWNLDSDTLLENGKYQVTLVARWEINEYDVTVTLNPSRDFVQVYLDGTLYTGEAQRFVYGDTIEIVVKVLDREYKLTLFNGESVAAPTESAEGYVYTLSYTVGISNELSLTVLPMIDASGVRIHFATETLILPMGVYRIYCDDTIYSVIVGEDGKYLVAKGGQAAVEVDRFVIPEGFFGKTLTVRMYGVEHVSADRECIFELPARPAAPEKGGETGDWIKEILPSLNTVKIQMAQKTQGYFEYACVLKGTDPAELQWFALDTDENGFLIVTGLYGTDYEVYIRVKAVETDAAAGVNGAPHGEAFGPYAVRTVHRGYIDDVCNALDERRTGGDMVDTLIDATKEKIRAIDELHPTVQNEVEAILTAFEEAMQLAEKQDDIIDALLAKHAQLLATNQFDANGTAALALIVDDAVAKIKQISQSSELTELTARLEQVDLYFREAVRQMGTVPIAHLYSKDHQLTVSFGLLQGSRWTVAMGDYEALVESIENAIRNGNVAMDCNGVDRSLLETMVVRAYYTMTLELPSGAYPESGVYKIRLLLPEELRASDLGMQVAYYDETTGELVILDTHRDGDYLIFESTRSGIGNFVILCDEEMDLTGLMIGLSVTLLAQLIAIVYLFLRRSKSAKMSRHYGLALPAVLAIRFLPANALTITVVLGILVILCQIFLTVLLLSTDVTYRYKDGSTPSEHYGAGRKRRRRSDDAPAAAPEEEDETTAYEPLEEQSSAEDEPILVALTEDESSEDAADEETTADDGEDATATFLWDEDATDADGATDEDPFGFMESTSEEMWGTEEHAEEPYATEEVYAFDTDTDGEEIPGEAVAWEYDEPVQDENDEQTDEDVVEETVQAAVWEPDGLAPDAEEELVYEDDYITGDPSEPVPYEDDISGDPNPFENSDDEDSERET